MLRQATTASLKAISSTLTLALVRQGHLHLQVHPCLCMRVMHDLLVRNGPCMAERITMAMELMCEEEAHMECNAMLVRIVQLVGIACAQQQTGACLISCAPQGTVCLKPHFALVLAKMLHQCDRAACRAGGRLRCAAGHRGAGPAGATSHCCRLRTCTQVLCRAGLAGGCLVVRWMAAQQKCRSVQYRCHPWHPPACASA